MAWVGASRRSAPPDVLANSSNGVVSGRARDVPVRAGTDKESCRLFVPSIEEWKSLPATERTASGDPELHGVRADVEQLKDRVRFRCLLSDELASRSRQRP